MGGLSDIGRAAGAAMGGFNQTLNNDQQYRERQQRIGLDAADGQWRQRERDRQQQQWQREDEERAILQSARAAGARVMTEDQQAYQAEATKAVPGPTFDGGPVPRAPAPAYRAKDQTLLRAARAEYDELFKRGRQDLGMQKYVSAAAMRTRIQEEAGMRAMRALQMGGDFITPFKELDEQMDDGLEADGEEVRGPNGERAFKITQTNRFTGEATGQPMTYTQQQMQMIIAQRMADPKATIKLNFDSYMESLKARHDEQNDGRQHRLNLERDKANRDSAEAVARGNNATALKVADMTANRGSGTGSTASLFREERLVAQGEVNALVDQLQATRRPQERAAIQAQLTAAQKRVRDIGQKISDYSGARSGAGRPMTNALAMPSSKSQLKAGQVYRTARGDAVWTGSAFQLEAQR